MFGINGSDDASGGSDPYAQAMTFTSDPNTPTMPGPMHQPQPPVVHEEPAPGVPAPGQPASSPGDELIYIKQQALQSLAPMVDHLDQTPEEKFKTTMMLIQASDNPHLIKDAYAAASQITNEKTRAQALLDVINEINYFTQNNKPD